LKRWLIGASRTGTVLVAVGLALLLVSVIPPGKSSTFGGSGPRIAPESFQTFGYFLPPFANISFSNFSSAHPFLSTLTPQQKLEIDLTCNGTLDVYLLKKDNESFSSNFKNGRSVSALQDYLQKHPEIVGLHAKVNLTGKVEYSPTEVINATVILSNPSQNAVLIGEQEGSIFVLLGPSHKAQMVAAFVIPIGLVLALPLILTQRKRKPLTVPNSHRVKA